MKSAIKTGQLFIGLVILLAAREAECREKLPANCAEWQNRFDKLSVPDQTVLRKFGVLRRAQWIISPSLVGNCEMRLGVENYLGDAMSGDLSGAQEAFVRHHRSLLLTVLSEIWPLLGNSPAVPADGAFNHEKWEILRKAGLPPKDLTNLLSSTLIYQGVSGDLVNFELGSPTPGLETTLEIILRREEDAAKMKDPTSTTQIYCLAILYSLGSKDVPLRLELLLSKKRTTPTERRVISSMLARMRSKKPIVWQDIETLESEL